MYVITVIPLSRGIGKETLSYFTASKVELGSLVSVPLRAKMVDALAIKCEDARMMKSEIKSADFTLRKIDKLVSKPFLPPGFIRAAEKTARFHAATMGATLNVLLPKKILAHISDTTPQIVAPTVVIVPTKERQLVMKKRTRVPVLLPSDMSLILPGTKKIIIEEVGSVGYKSITRPFINFRYALECYAEEIGASIEKKSISLYPKVKKLIEEHIKEDKRKFTSIGKHLEEDLKSLKETPRHLFVLATRRGHSGTVLCQDCGSTNNCKRCEAPLTLHMKTGKEDFNNLVCHHCGYKETALKKCDNCGSWRLVSFGLGVEKIEEDIKAFVKKHNIKTYIQRIDSTLKLTPKRIRDFVSTHYKKENAILIATEIALPYLVDAAHDGKKNDASYIPSLDTLLSLPDFNINEKIWRLCCQLDAVSIKKVIIQTRNAQNSLLLAWKENKGDEFWENEMRERKTFSYPPHGTLIKITVKGKKENIGREMKQIERSISKWKPMVFPAFIKTINNQHILHCLLALPEGTWVDEDLLEILSALPPSVRVEVNPRSLL